MDGGATYSFTCRLARPAQVSLIDQIDAMRAAYAGAVLTLPFKTEAIVVLPDHFHAIWTIPEGNSDIRARWRHVRAGFVRRAGLAGTAQSRAVEHEIWEGPVTFRQLSTAGELRASQEAIWADPMRHGLVARPADWPHGSFRRDVACGLVTSAWQPGADLLALTA